MRAQGNLQTGPTAARQVGSFITRGQAAGAEVSRGILFEETAPCSETLRSPRGPLPLCSTTLAYFVSGQSSQEGSS